MPIDTPETHEQFKARTDARFEQLIKAHFRENMTIEQFRAAVAAAHALVEQEMKYGGGETT
jgi:hypothetical protein